MAIIREVEFGDGTVVTITDWGDYPLHSRAVFDAGDAAALVKTYLFNYKVGDMMPAINIRATLADTNMPGAGQLPMGHQMLVYSMQAIPDEHTSETAQNIVPEFTVNTATWKWRKIFHQTYVQLVVEQTKSFVEGRLDYFPMGGGLIVSHNNQQTNGQNMSYLLHNGDRGWNATRRLAVPIHLGSLENWDVSLGWPRGGVGIAQTNYSFDTGFAITLRLTGPRQRPTA